MKSWLLAIAAFLVGLVTFALLRSVYRRRRATLATPFNWAKALSFWWPEVQPLGPGEVCAKPFGHRFESKIYHHGECEWARMISRPIRFASWHTAERAGLRPCRTCRPDLLR